MANNPSPHKVQQPFSMKHARSGGTYHTSFRDIVMHAPLLARDYYHTRFDFDNLAIASMPFWAVSSTGAGAADPVLGTPAVGLEHVAVFTTGGGNPGVSTLYGAQKFDSDDNPMIYVRLRWPAAVTNFAWEIGFVNVATTKTTAEISALTAAAVPTAANNLTDGTVLCMNTGYTLATPALTGVGTSTAIAGTKLVLPGTTTALTLTAAKWVDIYVQARVGASYCEIYENDVFKGQHQVASGADTGIALFPWIQFRDLGTSKVVNVDTVDILTERNIR